MTRKSASSDMGKDIISRCLCLRVEHRAMVVAVHAINALSLQWLASTANSRNGIRTLTEIAIASLHDSSQVIPFRST